ncbi:MAG: hypothetical protein RIR18_628 [Pseudomonadota bacterium]|jgi:type I restriction enzyme S subunit
MPSSVKKRGLVPKLRFPEFRDAGEWVSEFGDVLFNQISNKDHNSDLPVLAITQEYGAIPRNLIDYHVSVTETSIESYKVVEVGDFIISLRSFQGGIEYSNYKGICSPAYVVLRLKTEHSANYFKHFLKTSRFIALLTKNLEGLRDGKMVSYKQFSELQLPTPPLNEQQKIADCLTSLDELLTLETQKLATLKTHKKGLMQQLFPAEGETLPKLRFPEFRDAGEWEEKTLGKICNSISSGKDKNDLEGHLDLYGSTGVIGKTSKASFNGVYILVARVGANAGFTNKANGIFGVTDNTLVINLQRSEQVTFVFYWLDVIDLNRLIFGSGQPLITGTQLKDLVLFLPSYKEQQRIADCLASLDDLIAAQTQKLTKLKTHKKGLMQQLFPVLDEVTA